MSIPGLITELKHFGGHLKKPSMYYEASYPKYASTCKHKFYSLHPELLWCSCFAKLPGLQVFYLILKLIHSTYFLLLFIIQSSTWNSSGEQADIVQSNQLLLFFSFQTENHYQKNPLFFFFKLSSYHHGPENSSTASATVNISTRQQDKVLFQLNDRTPRIALEEYFTLSRNKIGQLWIDAWGPHTQSHIFHHSPIRKKLNKFSILIHAVKGTRITVRKSRPRSTGTKKTNGFSDLTQSITDISEPQNESWSWAHSTVVLTTQRQTFPCNATDKPDSTYFSSRPLKDPCLLSFLHSFVFHKKPRREFPVAAGQEWLKAWMTRGAPGRSAPPPEAHLVWHAPGRWFSSPICCRSRWPRRRWGGWIQCSSLPPAPGHRLPRGRWGAFLWSSCWWQPWGWSGRRRCPTTRPSWLPLAPREALGSRAHGLPLSSRAGLQRAGSRRGAGGAAGGDAAGGGGVDAADGRAGRAGGPLPGRRCAGPGRAARAQGSLGRGACHCRLHHILRAPAPPPYERPEESRAAKLPARSTVRLGALFPRRRRRQRRLARRWGRPRGGNGLTTGSTCEGRRFRRKPEHPSAAWPRPRGECRKGRRPVRRRHVRPAAAARAPPRPGLRHPPAAGLGPLRGRARPGGARRLLRELLSVPARTPPAPARPHPSPRRLQRPAVLDPRRARSRSRASGRCSALHLRFIHELQSWLASLRIHLRSCVFRFHPLHEQ